MPCFQSKSAVKSFEQEQATNFYKDIQCSEADIGDVLKKKVFLKISQNSQENACPRVYF